LKEEKELWRRRFEYPITTDFHGFPNIIKIEEKELFEQVRKFFLRQNLHLRLFDTIMCLEE
jgi:hypothetical protein